MMMQIACDKATLCCLISLEYHSCVMLQEQDAVGVAAWHGRATGAAAVHDRSIHRSAVLVQVYVFHAFATFVANCCVAALGSVKGAACWGSNSSGIVRLMPHLDAGS